jgi:hypothetical protein
MNIMQKRILENNKPKVDTRPRSTFLCLSWSAENQSGEISDSTGFRFGIISDDLAPECEGYLQLSERVSGIVDGPYVSNILIESGPRSVEVLREREHFDSVGPAPEVRGWNPHRGTPGIGRIRLGK